MSSAELDRRELVSGTALPLLGNDIDTDRIIPARFLKTITFDGLGEHAFADDRAQLRERGELHAFDDPRFREAKILLVNANFGCGSSREHAPQALRRAGMEAIVGESFAEIFFANCLAIGVPCVRAAEPAALRELQAAVRAAPQLRLRLDLGALELTPEGGRPLQLLLADGPRQALREGRWDSTTELLEAKAQIAATAARLPYVRGYAPDA